mgnify:FL=1
MISRSDKFFNDPLLTKFANLPKSGSLIIGLAMKFNDAALFKKAAHVNHQLLTLMYNDADDIIAMSAYLTKNNDMVRLYKFVKANFKP